jgi:hypothetical protein
MNGLDRSSVVAGCCCRFHMRNDTVGESLLLS